MIYIVVSNIRFDGPLSTSPGDILVRTGVDLAIISEGQVIYSETDFPVVELAAALSEWIRRPLSPGRQFTFDSMSTPKPGWVWIRGDENGWFIGSTRSRAIDDHRISDQELLVAIRSFVNLTRRLAAEELRLDIDELLEPDG